ncbi:MAG: hypothetical protein QM647_15120 [Asticcacaulis sp.]|uniref:hypothetical protein n=1 Tax=Asticcacaulis sp. TaxID=1872648 RepID=UPI0039E6F2C7
MFAKNVTNGPKGLNTKAGVIELAAGEVSTDVELEEAELKSMKAAGWFDFSAKAPKSDASDEATKAVE